MDNTERPWFTALGVVGYLARAVVLALAGSSSHALPGSTTRRTRSDSTVRSRSLRRQPTARPLLACTAAGLLAFALFCLVEARYRKV